MIYITKDAAISAGMTHEGTLFGVPAWLCEINDEEIYGAPKVPILVVWCWFADKIFDIFSYMVPSDKVLISPIKLGKRITG